MQIYGRSLRVRRSYLSIPLDSPFTGTVFGGLIYNHVYRAMCMSMMLTQDVITVFTSLGRLILLFAPVISRNSKCFILINTYIHEVHEVMVAG